MIVSNSTYIQTAISLVILSRLSNAFGNAPATKFMGYETIDAIMKYRIKQTATVYMTYWNIKLYQHTMIKMKKVYLQNGLN